MKKKLMYPMILITFAIVLFLGLSNSNILINIIKQIGEWVIAILTHYKYILIHDKYSTQL